MSSFICSSKHFNSIERTVINLTQDQNFYFPYAFKCVYPELYEKRYYTQDRIDSAVTEIVNVLRELNVLCVSLQYKHHYPGTLDKEISEQKAIVSDRAQSANLSKIELYKALICVSYQIEEQHLTELRQLSQQETNALFFIKEMKGALSADIIRSLPDYDVAAWEI